MSNNNTGRWVTIIGLLLITANIVSLIFLWTNHRGPDRKEGKPPLPNGQVFEYLCRELNLDSTQREQYNKLRNEHQALIKPLSDSLRKMKDSFFARLSDPKQSDTVLNAESARLGAIMQQTDLVTFRHFQQVRALCSPTQQEKFDSIIQEVLRTMSPQKRQGPPRPPRDEFEPGRRPPPPEGEGPPPPDREERKEH